MPRPIEPACGKCGYAVRGLDTFICPECGSDLRQVGIITKERPPLGWKIVAAVGLYLAASSLWLPLSMILFGPALWVHIITLAALLCVLVAAVARMILEHRRATLLTPRDLPNRA